MVKNLPANTGDSGSIPGFGRSPGGGLGNPSSILAWRIPWTEEPGGYSLGVPELDATEHMCALVATSSKIKHFHGLLGSLWRSPSLSCSEFILPTTLFHPVPAGHSHCGLTLSTGHLFMAPS